MRIQIVVIGILIIVASCKKADERSCWKGTGDITTREILLDSVNFFHLNKGAKYRIFEDTLKKIIVKGGENLIGLIDVQNIDYRLTVSNLNKCNFLRKSESPIEIEIHYPYLSEFYIEPSDSIVFENTVTSNSLEVELREGGGSLIIDVAVDYLRIFVSKGTADYTLSGTANNATIKVQHNGFADASSFTANTIFGYSNSTTDLKLNLTNCDALIGVDGPGNIYYTGTANSIIVSSVGSGKLIEY